MTSGESSPPTSPTPPTPPDAPRPPDPTPNCTHNCGPLEQAGVDWRHWTCRCGHGYYTPNRVWISGSDVRNGRQPPRDQQPAGDR
ncbi:hypothetical protein ASPVEDRAFT_87295 [Aspergillus versicolor CBS 583.65]|uniref:Uncharacterized protein n=1 Tax=Aspergillus versicolor CBS 583.65 TaxID=1036611 RepID=A0A1L9PWZ2_ASPVE|nr:uncharacterized protein ASPVEDRAFT_87295 [Aspergillus versicolor CBS 583.65]OJJ05973.1 hypothetical protein ASPVEDRAFT_87295 [Aspergillus versicolor CBS 583.65]